MQAKANISNVHCKQVKEEWGRKGGKEEGTKEGGEGGRILSVYTLKRMSFFTPQQYHFIMEFHKNLSEFIIQREQIEDSVS